MSKAKRRAMSPIHLFGTEDARAVCGVDWMAQRPALAVSWTNRDKATCQRCLDRCAEILRGEHGR